MSVSDLATSFRAGLELIRTARRRFWWSAALWLPLTGLVLAISGSDLATMVLGVGGALWVLVCGIRIVLSECPRCGERYHTASSVPGIGASNPWTRNCMTCGLPLYASTGNGHFGGD